MSILHLELSADRAKKVAQLLGNDTARRIMDAVSDKSKSETALGKELGLPLSTVHYNVQRLQEAGLVRSDEYTYSEKGKEVRHYKLASEHVVISTRRLAEPPTILGGLVLTVAAAAITYFALRPPTVQPMEAQITMAPVAAPAASTPVWPWVLLGAGAMLVGILIVSFLQRYRA